MSIQQQPAKIPRTMKSRYQRAKTLIEGYASKKLVFNDALVPTWIDGSQCFWYIRDTLVGKEFRLVDAEAETNLVAFDHRALSEALTKVALRDIDPNDLPFNYIKLAVDPLTLEFKAFDQSWEYDAKNKSCQLLEKPNYSVREALSPNGEKLIFERNHNLWLRDIASGDERALTEDGEANHSYGTGTTAWGNAQLPEAPGIWSPDSQRFLTVQHDKRRVKSYPSVNYVPLADAGEPTLANIIDSSKTTLSTSVRPTLIQERLAFAGEEEIETFQVLAFDLVNKQIAKVNSDSVLVNYNDYAGFYGHCLWWGNDNRKAYFIDPERGDKAFHIVEFDTQSGGTRKLFTETSGTHITFAGGSHGAPLNRYLANTNELVWWSERSGWGHLYLYDLNNGQLKRTLTQGDWRVRNVLQVDEQRREILIQTSGRVKGRDPYYRDICRVSMDSGEITTLLSCDAEIAVINAEHEALRIGKRNGEQCGAVAPSSDYLVANRSRIDEGSVSVLLNRDGKEILELETTDLSRLPTGWQWPEPFTVKSADRETDLYGAVFRPSDFSPDKQYPVLNYLVSGPWIYVTPKSSFHSAQCGHSMRHYLYASALAELGFIVMLLDGRGTPLRSKAFQDESYGWIPASGNTDDHAYAIDQLVERFPYMDKNNIGIFSSAYRSGLQNFMERQDLYKACVQMLCLDDRLNGAFIGEKYEGLVHSDKAKHYPEDLVENLRGKLMLMDSISSSVSTAYPPAATFRIVEALQRANKDFEMLVLPHGGFGCNSYMFRRAFDFLTENLLGETPPKEFSFDDVNM
jgi:dipeptidyl-peptidase-4